MGTKSWSRSSTRGRGMRACDAMSCTLSPTEPPRGAAENADTSMICSRAAAPSCEDIGGDLFVVANVARSCLLLDHAFVLLCWWPRFGSRSRPYLYALFSL